MIVSLLQEILDLLNKLLESLIFLELLLQLSAFLVALVLSNGFRRILQRSLNRGEERLSAISLSRDIPWIKSIFPVLEKALRPLAAWIMGEAAVVIFDNLNLSHTLLDWAVPVLQLWFIYQLLRAFIDERFKPERAQLWGHQILRPVALSIGLLHALGFLNRILDLGFRLSDSRITLGAVLAGSVIMYLFLVLSRGSRHFLAETLLPRAGIEDSLTKIVATFTGYGIIVTGLFIALGVVGIPLTTFTVIAGGLSVGLGFGLQELISNFVSGFILIFERVITPGDIVEIEDTIGRVEHVGIRSTQIRSIENVDLVVPNNYFLNQVVTNYTRTDQRLRLRVSVTVGFDADPWEVQEALLAAAASNPRVLAEPEPTIRFSEFGDYGFEFDLVVWIGKVWRIGRFLSSLRFNVYDELKARDIPLARPHRDLYFRQEPPGSRLPRQGRGGKRQAAQSATLAELDDFD